MQMERLNAVELALVARLADGYAVKHGGDFRGTGAGHDPGRVYLSDGSVVDVAAAQLDALVAAGVPLFTYEHNAMEGWKTIVPLPKRESVRQALANHAAGTILANACGEVAGAGDDGRVDAGAPPDHPPIARIDCHGRTFTAVTAATRSPSDFASDGETPSYAMFEIDQTFCDRLVALRNLAVVHGLYDVRARCYPTWLGAPDLRTECDVLEVDGWGADAGSFRFSCSEKYSDLQFTSETIDFATLIERIEAAAAADETVICLGELDASQLADAYDDIPCVRVEYGANVAAYVPEVRLQGKECTDARMRVLFEQAFARPHTCIVVIDTENRYTPEGDTLDGPSLAVCP